MSRFRFHKYEWSKPWGLVRHNWSFIGRTGAMNFHVSETPGYPNNAGLEFHYVTPPPYMSEDAPYHIDCPLTGGRCWHDGTSLYASETVWPIVQSMLRAGDHEAIFRYLEGEYSDKFDARSEESEGV